MEQAISFLFGIWLLLISVTGILNELSLNGIKFNN